MGNLAAWHLASTIRAGCERPATRGGDRATTRITAKQGLARSTGKSAWHDSLNQLSDVVPSPEWAKGNQGESWSDPVVTVLERATRLEVDAIQASYQEWDRIRNWKDRVRGLRGQARLCGTWQWIIHNHQQHHQEQKLSLLFPPAGKCASHSAGTRGNDRVGRRTSITVGNRWSGPRR